MITKQMIRNWGPCYEDNDLDVALDRLFEKESITALDILQSDRSIYADISDIAWLLFRPEIIGDRLCHQIGIFCWEEIAKPIWDKQYPTDSRPNNAVECKKRWLDGKATNEELAAARSAARSAAESAWSAAELAGTAELAARLAGTAELAAESACSATESAACSATESVAWEKIYAFVLKELVE